MKGFILINSLEGNTTAKIETNIYIKEHEKLDKFKQRIKKLKIYNEELILEELYNFVIFSKQLRQVLEEDKKTNFKYYQQLQECQKELNKLKIKNEKIEETLLQQIRMSTGCINKEA